MDTFILVSTFALIASFLVFFVSFIVEMFIEALGLFLEHVDYDGFSGKKPYNIPPTEK